MPNPTNNKLVDSKTIAALFDMTPRRVQQLTKEGVIAAIEAAGFDARIRPEALTLEDFAKIQQALAAQ